MRPVQRFSDEYLDRCREMSPNDIVQFLEDFRRIHGKHKGKSRLISIKIPEHLLTAFKAKAALENVRYQTQIKRLMKNWLVES